MHDYNCCLVDLDNGRLAMREAERSSRRKHHVILEGEDLLTPIRECCEDLGTDLSAIEVVAFAHTDYFPVKEKFRALFPKAEFVDVDHHLSHVAAGYFSSEYEHAAVVSLDGFGDGASGLIVNARGNKLEILERISDANSIGLEYLRATYHIGLGGYGSEGKTQGLAPYGEPTYFDRYMQEIEILPSGNVRLSGILQSEHSRLAEEGGYINSHLLGNALLHDLFPRRIDPEPLAAEHKNLAASVQKVLEHVGLEICRIGQKRTGSKNLVLSGGVCMNSSMNGVLMQSGLFDSMLAVPMASDRGTAIGAALYHAHVTLDAPRFFKLSHVFYGGAWEDPEVALKAMQAAGMKAEKVGDAPAVAAKAVSEGKIVGWVQGRSELGARALGHRSIVADPRQPDMRDIVNHRVKHREWFRPFAPSVLAGKASDYFVFPEGVADLSFMTFTAPASAKAAEKIPSTVHVDQTSRLQTVYKETNPLYYSLIENFEALTGVPVVLNTSFNDKGEPIVESPEDAVRSFLQCDMDLLCIGSVVGRKA